MLLGNFRITVDSNLSKLSKSYYYIPILAELVPGYREDENSYTNLEKFGGH